MFPSCDAERSTCMLQRIGGCGIRDFEKKRAASWSWLLGERQEAAAAGHSEWPCQMRLPARMTSCMNKKTSESGVKSVKKPDCGCEDIGGFKSTKSERTKKSRSLWSLPYRKCRCQTSEPLFPSAYQVLFTTATSS